MKSVFMITAAALLLSISCSDNPGGPEYINPVDNVPDESISYKIALLADESGYVNKEIFIINSNGTGLTPLPESGGALKPRDLQWSPDGSYIIYSVDGDIHSVKSDGTDHSILTSGDSYEIKPRWSPESTRIAYLKDGDLFIMNKDGSNSIGLTNNRDIRDIDWKPDGSCIVFSVGSGISFFREIYRIDIDGSHYTQLTFDDAFNSAPVFSPDGSRIAYLSGPDFPENLYIKNIYIMNSDGSNKICLTVSVGGVSGAPQWSPDGSRIAFVYTDDKGYGPDICTMRPDGTDKWRLTLKQRAFESKWSPDGASIAYLEGLSYELRQLRIMTLNGTQKKVLAPGLFVREFSFCPVR
ncbi:TolB family protein [candidate division KSB1 bacterium]